MSAFLWILLALNIGLTGDICLKKGGWMGLAVGCLLFTLTAFPTWKAYQGTSFSSLTILWQSMYLVLGLTVAKVVFGDRFTAKKWASIALALAAILLAGD
jgi:drug/metabolite transporter (DMT)-like permease